MIKIFLIEDDDLILGLWKSQFDRCRREGVGEFTLITASSIQEAQELFKLNQGFDVIVVDCRIIGPHGFTPSSVEKPNTLGLVSEFRKTYGGHMIAVSGSEETQKELVKAGCSDYCNKINVLKKVLEVLGLERKEEKDIKTPSA